MSEEKGMPGILVVLGAAVVVGLFALLFCVTFPALFLSDELGG